MNLENGTSDPVDYDQSGGGTPQEEERHQGTIPSGDSVDLPVPAGTPPYTVVFSYPPDSKVPTKVATASDIYNDNAIVRLCPDWTTAVDRKCGST